MSEPRGRYGLGVLLRPAALARLAVIGAVAGASALAFAYADGRLTPQRLTRRGIIEAFNDAGGVHPGFRRNHAKGVCISGVFQSSGQGAALSRAAVFRPGAATPVTGRLALAGGMPAQADAPTTVRSMALSLRPPHGQEWRTGMNDIPVFVVNTPQAFWEQLVASKPDPATGKPDPAAMKAFLSRHPETARALAAIKAQGFSSGFANAAYNSLDAFRFVDAAGVSTPVRWSMVPVDPFAPAGPPLEDANGLFQSLFSRIARGPLMWRLVATVGQPGDPTADATVAWPAGRRQVELGVLTIDHAEPEAAGNCRDLNFDPLVLPDGIAPSDDPLLGARSATYAKSFTLRAGEAKTPSAVQLPPVGKGA